MSELRPLYSNRPVAFQFRIYLMDGKEIIVYLVQCFTQKKKLTVNLNYYELIKKIEIISFVGVSL